VYKSKIMFDHFHLQTLFDRFQNLKPYKYNKHNSKIVEHHGVTWRVMIKPFWRLSRTHSYSFSRPLMGKLNF